METSPQPQFIRFQNEPQEEGRKLPFWNKEKRRRLGILVSGSAILLGLGIFARNVIKEMSAERELTALEETQALIEARQEDCAEEDETCKRQVQTSIARASGIAEACEGLEGSSFKNCITLIAREEKDQEMCLFLEDEEQAACNDVVLLARAEGGEGMAVCEEVQDAAKKHACQNIVTSTARTTGDCATYGVDESVCMLQETIAALLAAGDMSGCTQLSEEGREWCNEIFSSTDVDGDGLTAKEEAELGTSDERADTDGDGYSDRTEVEAGYNPLN